MTSKSDEIWGKLREAWRFTVKWLCTFRDANGLMNSAAMAFFAMLSLVPFLVVSAGAVELFTDTAPDEALKELPSYGSASGLMGYFLPFVSKGLVTQVRTVVVEYDFTGPLGLFTLVFTAGLFFSAIERSVRAIFQRKFSPVGSLARVFSLLGSVAVLFCFLAGLFSIIGKVEAEWMAPFVSFGVITGGFTVAVMWFGTRALRKRDIATGGIVFYALWQLANQLFSVYLDVVPNFELLYGSLASIVVVMLWIFYASMVFLLSCSLVQSMRVQSPSH